MISQIIISLITVVLGVILTIYAQEYIPDAKTLNSYIRKFFSITFRYILPISEIILFSIYSTFNKAFVLQITFLSCFLIFSFLYDFLNAIIKVQKNNVAVFENMLKCSNCLCSNLKEIKPDFKCTVGDNEKSEMKI